MTQVMNSLPTRYWGFGSGSIETTRQLGHGIGILIPTIAVGNALTDADPSPALTTGLTRAWLAVAALAALGLLITWVATRRTASTLPATSDPATLPLVPDQRGTND
jgi:hypothetical protein